MTIKELVDFYNINRKLFIFWDFIITTNHTKIGEVIEDLILSMKSGLELFITLL